MHSITKRKPWSRDELILTCNLYFGIAFDRMHARDPSVVAMARLLGRTPASISMKLGNFASLDPAHRAQGFSGLRGVSRADREVWEEFHSNWSSLASESEKLLGELLSAKRAPVMGQKRGEELLLPPPTQATERTATVQVRIMQSFFRKAVLAAYGSQCCVTGNPVPQLLIASHILPWSEFPEHRVNPCNGLCFAAHFDRAFDHGLITFTEGMKLVLSPELRAYLPDKAIEREFLSVEGAPLRMPERFPPGEQFLAYHRRKVFRP